MSSHLPPLIHPKYRPDIDGLRAVAVLSVVIFHAFPRSIKGGFVGVDVFFVISGFLISTSIFENLRSGTFSFSGFYARRIKRIFPALILILAVSCAFGWHALFADEYQQLGKHIAASAGFISNFVFWSESGYFDGSPEAKPMLHMWSLGVEEQFYVIWPLLLWGAWKRGGRFLLTITLIAFASFFLNVFEVTRDQAAAFYSPQTRFWELLGGSLLAWVGIFRADGCPSGGALGRLTEIMQRYQKGIDDGHLANVMSGVGLALLFFAFVRINKGSSFPGFWAMIPVLGAMLIISAGPRAWGNRILLSNKVVVWLGLISYPLYLWHWPLISFAWIIQSGAPSRIVRMAVVVLSILLAWITYRLIERPIRYGRGSAIKVVLLVVVLAAVGSLGYGVYRNGGYASRGNIKEFEIQKTQFSFTQDMGRSPGARVMLLGDSHAGHLVPGLKREFGTDIADYTEPGCIPFYDVDRYDSRVVPGSCVKAMNLALSKLEKSNMSGVILSTMGPAYLTGEVFKDGDRARVTGLVVKLETHPEITDRWEVFAYGLRDTIARLLAAKKKILFVLDVPEIGFEARGCLDVRPVVLKSRKPKVCAVPRADYDARAARYKQLVLSVLSDFPEVRIYDPTDDFCDKDYCWAFREGRFLYRDTDHLSNEGSYFIASRLAPLVRELF